MTSPHTSGGAPSLTQRRPVVPPDRLLAELVPPRHFADESFATYRPDPAHPSQAAAVDRLSVIAEQIRRGGRRSFWKRGRTAPVAVYLDGGFGVGKTHLLASLAHAVGVQHAAYGTFVEYTNLVGALGFLPTVEALATRRLVCIDEFELDDPGDTVLMSRLLRELADRASRSPPRRTPCPARWARAGSPPRTSCARSRRWPPGSRSCGSTATTTGTGRS